MTVETIIAPAAWHDAIVHGDYSRWDYLGDNVEAERAEALEDSLSGPCVFAESIGDDVHPADTDTPDEPRQEFMRYAILNIVEPPDRPGTNWDPMVQARILAEGSRELIIDWLQWNDPNGCYSDIESDSEGFPRMTLDDARRSMLVRLEEAV